MVTLPILVTQRRERIRLLSLHLAAIVKAVSSHVLAASNTFFDAMAVNDGNDYINSASEVLEALSLPPLPEDNVKGGSAARAKSSSQADRTSVSANADKSPPPPPGGAIEGQEV